MSAPLGTRPEVGRKVFYRDPNHPDAQEWLPATVVRVRPSGGVDLRLGDGPIVKKNTQNGVKPGQWCGWADDLWLPREGGELMRGQR